MGKRINNLEGAPKVSFDTAKNFFKRLNKNKSILETWVGELYLELHRGTLTTHGLVKKQNRKLENKLKAVSFCGLILNSKSILAKNLIMLGKNY